MGCYANMPPPWMWGNQGPSNPAPAFPNISDIQSWIRSLEDLKKSLKDEPKKDDKKKEEPKVSVIAMMAFMLLISPVTGPAMYHFFQMSLGLIK